MLYLYICICALFCFVGFKLFRKLWNPLTLFNGLWLFIVLLYQLKLSNWQEAITFSSYISLIINVMGFSLIFIGFYFLKRKEKQQEKKKKIQLSINYNTIKIMYIIWLIAEIIETIVSGGLPIIWHFTGDPRTYAEYGIPTLHGLMNSLSLVIMIASFYLYLKEKKNKKLLFIIASILVFDLCIITRQVIISVVIELFVIYLSFHKKFPIKQLAVLTIVAIFLFGVVGNIRTGFDNFVYVSSFKNSNINPLFAGFYWVYMYLTMTIANVNNAVTLGINHFGAYPIFQSYIPTVISDILFANYSVEIPRYLMTNAFNVSGYFIKFYLGFGNLGILFIAGVFGALGAFVMRLMEKDANEEHLLYLAIYTQILLLSFFENHLLYLPSGFQFVIVWLLFFIIKRRKRND